MFKQLKFRDLGGNSYVMTSPYKGFIRSAYVKNINWGNTAGGKRLHLDVDQYEDELLYLTYLGESLELTVPDSISVSKNLIVKFYVWLCLKLH